MNPSTLALIAAPPDSLRYSLRALLARLPQIDEVRAVDDTRSLLATLPELLPRLIVLDVNLLRDEAGPVLDLTKAAAPHACIVVLVDRTDQQQALQATPADRVLLKGYPAADLFATLTRLLTPDDSSIDS
ncbi:MAG: response regulator transcription factor [Chloroflexi bacterium]|nr:response regulator transcription factor [Chloroflexota bacterium]